MRFSKHTLSILKEMAKHERFSYFFDSVSNISEDEDEKNLIEKLANIFIIEFALDWDKIDKVKYFLWLAYHAKK